jgi:hypothetical protein
VYAGAKTRAGAALSRLRPGQAGWGNITNPKEPVRIGFFRDWVFQIPRGIHDASTGPGHATVNAKCAFMSALSTDLNAFSNRAAAS